MLFESSDAATGLNATPVIRRTGTGFLPVKRVALRPITDTGEDLFSPSCLACTDHRQAQTPDPSGSCFIRSENF
jgi:hypothetical protein